MEDSSIEYYFKELQCPFTWNINNFVVHNKSSIIDRLLNKNEEVSGQPWINLLLLTAAAYELYKNKENSRAHNELEKSINILENEKNDEFLNKYKEAFQHVVYSVKLFFMRDKVTASEIKEQMEMIPLYSNLSPEQKVAIIGIQANISAEYGPQGSKHALILAREALEKNPEEAEWSLFVGLLLRRIRHYTVDQNITDEELHCLENAYKKNKTSQNAVFLAESYLDFARSRRFTKDFRKDGKQISTPQRFRLTEEYNKKSYNLYREALNLNEKSNKDLHIKIRCINGLFKLIRKQKRHKEDLQDLLSEVNQCLEASPDSIYCNDVASRIYFDLKDNKNGFKYANIAANLGSYNNHMYLLEKKLEFNIKFDSEEAFKEVLTYYPVDIHLYRTYAFAMAYYIFQEYNISLMLKYFFMASEKKMERQDFVLFLFFIKTKVDVCFLVYNEVILTLDGKKYRNDAERKQLEEALKIFHSSYPDVENMEVEKDLKEKFRSKKYK